MTTIGTPKSQSITGIGLLHCGSRAVRLIIEAKRHAEETTLGKSFGVMGSSPHGHRPNAEADRSIGFEPFDHTFVDLRAADLA